MIPLKHAISRILGILCIVVFTALVVDVLWGVGTRYLLRQSAVWTEELARLLLLWLSMLGGALAYIENKHLGVDVVTRAMHPSAQRIANLTTHVVVLLFAGGVLVYGGGALFIDRWESGQMMSAIPMKKAWFYLSLPVSGLLIAIFALDAVIATLQGRPGPWDDPADTDETAKSTPEAKSA